MKPEPTERSWYRRQLNMYLCGKRVTQGARRCCKKHLRRAIRRAVQASIRIALLSE